MGQDNDGRTRVDESAKRARLVRYAVETIAEEGFAKASLSHIATRAGVSKGVISYHFAGKEELIQEVVTSVMADMGEAVFSRMDEQPGAVGKLRAYIESVVAYMRVHQAELLAVVEIARSRPGGSGTSDLTGSDPVVRVLAALLAQGQEEGELRDFPPRLMALWLQAMINALLMELVARGDELDLDLAARELITVFELATHRRA
ncbi:TetR/AcrR family transcriptional regulator [Streptosporangium sp. NPDC006013]|uniref:TetR/AcrR family transcriptional regulator n=1 Tax=Streptosporangium sp. NPDC006013 TaxID=3155596 RepID=UPI0033AB8A5A